jgi:hypothetical protein
MKFRLDGDRSGVLYFRFVQWGGFEVLAYMSPDIDVLRDVTKCTLKVGDWQSTALACRNPSDPPDRARGRRVALKRALRVAASRLSRQDRTAIWKAYFEHHADLRR